MSNENRKISFGEIKIGKVARNRIKKALDINWISEGDNTREFEKLFAERFNYKHAIATSSGTTACMSALMTLYDLTVARRGDEIIVPATTFVATANAILASGFIPRFVDIGLNTLNVNPSLIEENITGKTVALMPVHLMGKPCDMDKIMSIAHKYDLRVVEDCCEAHGAKYHGCYVGSFGDMGCFSFYVAHPIVCGEGGMVVTDDDKTANIVRSVKSHGRPGGSISFDFQRFGLNCKTNNLCSAIGVEGMINLDEDYSKRKKNLHHLMEYTADLGKYMYMIKEAGWEWLCPHGFPMVLKNPKKHSRDQFIKFLNDNGIEAKTLFGSLPTQHNAFSFLKYTLGDFPVAEYVGNHGLHLGVHQYLSEEDIEYISNILHKFFRK